MTFLTTFNGRDTEFNMLNFIENSLQGEPVKEPVPYFKTGNLDNFDIIMETFKKFQNGGYWVKKIRKDGRTFYEETEGPYEKGEAMTRAKILNNSLTLENVKTAEVYTFFQLVCDDSDDEKEYKNNIGSYVKPEAGSSLLLDRNFFVSFMEMKILQFMNLRNYIRISRSSVTLHMKRASDM